MNVRNVLLVVMFAVAVAAVAGPAQAALYFYEPFDYTVGESIDGKVGPGFSWTGGGERRHQGAW